MVSSFDIGTTLRLNHTKALSAPIAVSSVVCEVGHGHIFIGGGLAAVSRTRVDGYGV